MSTTTMTMSAQPHAFAKEKLHKCSRGQQRSGQRRIGEIHTWKASSNLHYLDIDCASLLAEDEQHKRVALDAAVSELVFLTFRGAGS